MNHSICNRFLFCFMITFLIFSLSNAQDKNSLPISPSTNQLIVVITESFETSDAVLFLFERENSKTKWNKISDEFPVIVGKNGIGWGKGLQNIDYKSDPVKVEGDGKSPAGVFNLSVAFGFSPKEKLEELKMPYIHVTDLTECIDDINSKFYNNIVYNNQVDTIDWNSSEKMHRADPWYRFGVVIDQNSTPITKGSGSCIFLHNWSGPTDSTVGCTAMASAEMKKIVFWLDSSKNPVLVQFPKQRYIELKSSWKLPELWTD